MAIICLAAPCLSVSGVREGANTVHASVRDIVFQGSRIQAHVVSADDEPFLIETGGELPAGLAPGQHVPVSWAMSDTLVYPAGATP
jgi:putative spermidine/putrescine transport system ATP-binding protein